MTQSPFEARLRALLQPENSVQGKALMAAYDSTVNYMARHVYEEIKATEPQLTDHGLRHIQNVQQNALKLIPVPTAGADAIRADLEDKSHSLSALEMYCLGMFILFHDAGNVESRKGHERNIGGIFDDARGTSAETKREKTLVLRACAAHTGQSREGTHDTLKDLPEFEQFEGERIRLRQLAAILRFADELAEGPQRTSEHRRNRGQYDSDSRLYHDYASVTHVLVDRGNGRISLAYEISVDRPPDGRDQRDWLTDLMALILKRIRKLDQERRYAVHYAPLLAPFKATDVSFNFHCGEELMDMDLPPLRLDDFAVPGTNAMAIEEEYPALSPGTLVPDLIHRCKEPNPETDQ